MLTPALMSTPGVRNSRHANRAATLFAFTLATGMEQWIGSGINVTLTDLTGSLSASADEASWAITVYSTAFAVSVALTHRFASFLGERRLLSLACLSFATGSFGCATSDTLTSFLIFRAVQGVAGGVFLARALVFITFRYTRAERASNLRLYGAGFFMLGRFIAPFASGWSADALSWRWVFATAVPVMLVASFLFHRYTAKTWQDDVEEYSPDYLGIFLLLLGVAALQTALSRGEIDDWFGSNRIVVLTTIGIVCNLLFAAWQFTPGNKKPLLNLWMLRDRGLLSATVLGAVLGMQLAGSLYVLPQYLRRVESHSAFQTGLLMSLSGLSGVLVLAVVPQVARVISELGGKAVMGFALFVQMTAMLWLGHIVTVDTPDRALYIPLLLNGVFVGIAVPTLALAAFIRMDNVHASSARSVYYGARQLGASVGVTFVVALIDRRDTLHSSRLIDSLFSRDLNILGTAVTSSNVGLINALVAKQSLVLTFADVFYVMGAIAAATLFLLPILPRGAAMPTSNMDEHQAERQTAPPQTELPA